MNTIDTIVSAIVNAENAENAEASAPAPVQFKPGWNYGLFLSRNGFAPSETRRDQWLELSREASKEAAEFVMEAARAGNAKVRESVKLTEKHGWQTRVTVSAVRNGADKEAARNYVIRQQARMAKKARQSFAAFASTFGETV